MITRRFILSGLIAAPAVIVADKLMKVHSLPKRYATVWGIGHNLEVIEHPIWEPMSVIQFGGSPHVDNFKEITDWVYNFPVEPIKRGNFQQLTPVIDHMKLFDRKVEVDQNGITNVVGYANLVEWRQSLRPDLNINAEEWYDEQRRLERMPFHVCGEF